MSTSSEVNKAIPNPYGPPKETFPLPVNDKVLTQNAIKIFGEAPNPRNRFIIQNLVRHLHEFVKETDITTEEWMTAIQFLTETGQNCTPIRQEFILLSDVLGVSALVDAINNPSVAKATETSVFGPFYTEDAHDISFGESIASEGKGDYLLVKGRVTDVQGNPVPNATIDTWETDGFGFYDTQYVKRDGPDCRGRLKTDENGNYQYRAIVPVSYPIPGDGPVGKLLELAHRHNNRPAHLHVMIQAPGYHKLVTALYPEGDPYLTCDAVFGVKESLVVKYDTIESDDEAKQYGFKHGPIQVLNQDFVLLSEQAAAEARAQVTEANILKNTNFV